MNPTELPNGTSGDVLVFPDSPLVQATIDLVTSTESAAIANHSVRSWLFARLLARHRGVDLGRDLAPDLLFHACVLHDVGLTERGDRHQRFEVDGADVAAEFLTEAGMAAADVDAVWEAIALHSSGGIAHRRALLTELTHLGIGVDFGFGDHREFVTNAEGAEIHRAYPRLAMATALSDEIVAQARRRPEKAPAYSLAAGLVRERSTPPYTTGVEAAAAASRWGA
ncbi:HD domain-containing protein [Actinocrispum wychmicini]|uniref:HD domain-containing protein n=1 Tax=Actinocrispum wychmicini TaxID=1213861 RepID=A0A4R2J8N3_9PSEU|nr:HD domain-containing protein [Actinocrispum wychmicini]TCO54102.1 HD domain-containing protein [Actinocrispum wychmicini]